MKNHTKIVSANGSAAHFQWERERERRSFFQRRARARAPLIFSRTSASASGARKIRERLILCLFHSPIQFVPFHLDQFLRCKTHCDKQIIFLNFSKHSDIKKIHKRTLQTKRQKNSQKKNAKYKNKKRT